MRRLLAIVGLLGIFLTPIPEAAFGGRAQAGQVGLASWYGKLHQGQKTASGERFSRGQLTAAHRSLPLGTKVKVTNLRTSSMWSSKSTTVDLTGAARVVLSTSRKRRPSA
jgi:hypothetical protein